MLNVCLWPPNTGNTKAVEQRGAERAPRHVILFQAFFFLTVSLSYVTQLSEEEIVFSWYCK